MRPSQAVRWATTDDDAAIRRLCVRTPMRGPISYCLEREPDFFALTRLQGSGGGRVAVIDHGSEIVAMAMMAPVRAWIGGLERRCAYIGDLKVDPAHRNSGLAGRVMSFLGRELQREGIDLSFFLALAGNPAMQLIEASPGDSPGRFEVRKLRTIRNFLVPFGAPRGSKSGVVVSRATPESVPEMIAFWNRSHRLRSFAPVLDEEFFEHWLSGPLSLGDFRVARREGVITGFCAVWDASTIKQIRLLRLSTGLRVATALYNIASGLRGRPRFPRAGGHLRFLYVSHVCAERPEDLETLLAYVHDQYRGDRKSTRLNSSHIQKSRMPSSA